MYLTIKDRIVFPQLFPLRGDMLQQMVVRDISEKVMLDVVERERIGLRIEKEGVRWNSTVSPDIEVKFTKTEINFLKDQIDRLDKEKAITQDILDLCIKIKGMKTIGEKEGVNETEV